MRGYAPDSHRLTTRHGLAPPLEMPFANGHCDRCAARSSIFRFGKPRSSRSRARPERSSGQRPRTKRSARETRRCHIESAQAALGKAKREHEEIVAEIEKDLAAVQ